jgi:hypothetical protein
VIQQWSPCTRPVAWLARTLIRIDPTGITGAILISLHARTHVRAHHTRILRLGSGAYGAVLARLAHTLVDIGLAVTRLDRARRLRLSYVRVVAHAVAIARHLRTYVCGSPQPTLSRLVSSPRIELRSCRGCSCTRPRPRQVRMLQLRYKLGLGLSLRRCPTRLRLGCKIGNESALLQCSPAGAAPCSSQLVVRRRHKTVLGSCPALYICSNSWALPSSLHERAYLWHGLRLRVHRVGTARCNRHCR